MIHTCKYCDYTTTRSDLYLKHIETDKHHSNVIQYKRDEELKLKEE